MLKKCEIRIDRQKIEEVQKFKYLGLLGGMESETRERTVQRREVIRSLGLMMREKPVSMEGKIKEGWGTV